MKARHFPTLLAVLLLMAASSDAHARQSCPWKATPTNTSGVFLGQAAPDGAAATDQDCVAAVDATGTVAGAGAVIVNSGVAYINVTIYGDDPTTADIDEGLTPGEPFSLYLWQDATGQVMAHAETFSCWQDANGAPMAGCGDVGTAYPFTLVNSAPEPPELATLVDGTTLVVGGAAAQDAQAAETPVVIDWRAPADPDGDALTYTWQLSLTDAFADADLLVAAATDTVTAYATTLGALAALLDGAGVTPGASATLWHRVLAHDALTSTPSDPAQVTLVRGTLVAVEAATLPGAVTLDQNYPNPFNPSTTVTFTLDRAGHVEFRLFDLRGAEVLRVDRGVLAAGAHQQRLALADLASGRYLYRLRLVDPAGRIHQQARVLTLAR